MSNYDEYILKMDTACTMKYQIEQLSLALERMKDEYKNWLIRNNVPMNIRRINNSSCIASEKYAAITKHEERECNKQIQEFSKQQRDAYNRVKVSLNKIAKKKNKETK